MLTEGISQLESLGSVLACPADAEATNLLLRDICGKRPANMAKISLALLPNCMPGQQAGMSKLSYTCPSALHTVFKHGVSIPAVDMHTIPSRLPAQFKLC